MALTTTIKRAPKWAWYIGGGAIEVYKRRAQDAVDPATATNDAQVVGSANGATSAPSPIVTPTVTVQPADGPDYTGMFSVFGDALNNAVATVGQLAGGDQGIAQSTITMIGQIASGDQDIARQAVANAGQAPAPAAQTPTPIIVQVPTAATPAIVPVAGGGNGCPASHPNKSSKGCYRCYKENGKWTHVYANGVTPTSRGNDAC
jgi:hypothetical protein